MTDGWLGDETVGECSAGRQLRRWRDSAEVQDVYDRIMALMAA